MTNKEAIGLLKSMLIVNQKEEEAVRVAVNALRLLDWRDPGKPPEDESYVLVSFENATFPTIAIFMEGDYRDEVQDKPLSALGLKVNGWMPLPETRKHSPATGDLHIKDNSKNGGKENDD
jgi:hypothetical protein